MAWLFHPLFTFNLMGQSMPVTWLTLFGLVGNLLFTGRVLIQWIASERAGRSVVPVLFWWVSLCATVIHIVYAYGRGDAPMFLGLSVTLIPYVRNLRIYYAPHRKPRPILPLIFLASVLMIVLVIALILKQEYINWWLFALGLGGNAVYRSRFLVQWLQSEARRESHMGLAFWYLSMIGSFILLAYSLLRGDVVFLLSFVFNSIPYLRNILLIRRQPKPPLATAGLED